MVSSRDASEHASKKGQEKGAAVLFNATAPPHPIRFPSDSIDVVPPDEETRLCGRWGTTSLPAKAHPIRKTWCFRTKKQGFAGGGAPRPCRRRPIQSERRGASGQRNKDLRAVEHHVPAGEGPSNPIDVVPPDEGARLCGQWGTTSRPPEACRPPLRIPPLAN